MSGKVERAVGAGLVGLAAGVAMAAVNGGEAPIVITLLSLIAGIATAIALKFVVGCSWRDTIILATLVLVTTWFVEGTVAPASAHYAMPYKQTDLILVRLTVPLVLLLAGAFLFSAFRNWKAWVIILGASAAANMLSVSMYGWGDFSSTGLLRFGTTVLLPMVALLAAIGYVLADEPT